MKVRRFLQNLIRFDGTVGPGRFALVGVLLTGLKFHIDRYVMWGTGHGWSFFDAVNRHWFVLPTDTAPPRLLLLAAIAAPFAWIGLSFTVRRLRDLGWPIWLCVTFLIPWVNLLFFLILALVPGRDVARPAPALRVHDEPRLSDRLLPRNRAGGAAIGAAVGALTLIAAIALSTHRVGSYGATLFLASPFAAGMAGVMVAGHHNRLTAKEAVGLGILSALFCGALALAFAFEGLVCMLMALPLALPLAALGGFIGYMCHELNDRRAAMSAVAVLPLLMLLESSGTALPPIVAQVTSVDISAPRETVWRHVVSFPDLEAPTELLFKAGIAYPIRASIDGTGVGAVRLCEFSTGPFVEPITIWDEPRHLRFRVEDQPRPMEEWTFYDDVAPPHVDGFFQSVEGEFWLESLADGGTRLRGTTWYRHAVWPNAYFRLWSDAIVERIHLRVLRHIRDLAEADAG